MIRLFNVYYPTRTLVLLLCEALLVGGVISGGHSVPVGPDTYIVLIYENGILKILGITVLTLLLSYYFDLYEPQRISGGWEIYFRLLLVLSVLCLSSRRRLFSSSRISILALMFLLSASRSLRLFWSIWRRAYEWIIGLHDFPRARLRAWERRTGAHG